MPNWLDAIRWNSDGLVPAIAQDADSLRVLTLAWMNRDALALTAASGEAHYWSRSRARMWRKGESYGHVQRIREIPMWEVCSRVKAFVCHITDREIHFACWFISSNSTRRKKFRGPLDKQILMLQPG